MDKHKQAKKVAKFLRGQGMEVKYKKAAGFWTLHFKGDREVIKKQIKKSIPEAKITDYGSHTEIEFPALELTGLFYPTNSTYTTHVIHEL